MSLSFSYTAIAIASSLFGAVATILARTLLKDIKSKDILGINFLTMAGTLVLLSPLFYHFEATAVSMGLVLLIAIIDTAANYFFFKTFEKTEASIAAPILSLAPAITFLFGWIFLSDTTGIREYVLAGAIIILVVIFSADRKNFSSFKIETLTPALLSSFLFGLSSIPSKYLLSTLHAINAPTLYMFRAGFIALLALLIFNFQINNISQRQFRIIFGRALIVIAQWILLYTALTIGNAGVSVTLANITPIFVLLLSILFLKEKPTVKKIVAGTLILVFSLLL